MTKTKSTKSEERDERSSLHILNKNKREQIHSYFHEYKGKRMFSTRVYVLGNEGDYVPTSKGLTIDAELINDFINSLCDSADDEEKKHLIRKSVKKKNQ